ncbi:MAG: hypothetical protein NC302_05055 [Bacteroidales bacterium]|nr:hypothetical protein [Bacteroidales bacterium]MCM1416495.1 hypothetical protein [bacterium]MCM1422666.1 hypothetical protein [bacterium]
MDSTMEIMNRGISCLIQQMGVVEAEKFISIINREKFDYTKWQQNLFDDMELEEINKAAAVFSKNNPL